MTAVENTFDAFEQKMLLQEKAIGILQKLWDRFLPAIEQPPKSQFAVWTAYNGQPDLPLLSYGIEQCAEKNLKLGGTMTRDHACRFISSVVSYHRRQRRQAGLHKAA
jgi:hypothetical protein